MYGILVVLAGALMSAVWLMPPAVAQTACVTQNMVIPPGANTTDKAAPFFIDTTGLDFKTQPPTREPNSPNYPRATELPDGTLPPSAFAFWKNLSGAKQIERRTVNRPSNDLKS